MLVKGVSCLPAQEAEQCQGKMLPLGQKARDLGQLEGVHEIWSGPWS